MKLSKGLILLSFGIIIPGIITGCGTKTDPLSGLSAEHKQFLFGEGRVAFLGKPLNGRPDCEFQNANQGYVFKEVNGDIYIDSLRPSGTITHKLAVARSVGDNIDITAINATNNKFDINFSNISNDKVDIDFGGEDKSPFLRCDK